MNEQLDKHSTEEGPPFAAQPNDDAQQQFADCNGSERPSRSASPKAVGKVLWVVSDDGAKSGPYSAADIERLEKAGLLSQALVVNLDVNGAWGRPTANNGQSRRSTGGGSEHSRTATENPPAEAARFNGNRGNAFGAEMFESQPDRAGDFGSPRRHTPNTDLWKWYAWMTGLGIPLCLLLVGIPMLIIGLVMSFILIYRGWSSVQKLTARTTPGAAIGFYFIPFFNIYWAYPAVVGLADDLNASMHQLRVPGPLVSRSLAIWSYVLYLTMFVPYVNLLTVIPSLVVYANVLKQIAVATDAINERRRVDLALG